MTKGSGDFGADLILKNNSEKIIVQAKRYKNKVGIQSAQEVIGAKRYYDAANDVLLIDHDLLFKLSAPEYSTTINS
ncbi:restriction endonuclease [Bacillus mycoides]|nr:restriction endonuclease [Bacillus mycoides]